MGFIADLFGNKATNDVLDKIDAIIDKIPLRSQDQHYDNLVNSTLKDVINVNNTEDKDKFNKTGPQYTSNLDEIEHLLQGITVPENRLRRYDTYDDIYKSIQLVKRVIKIYINNIFQKDPITNTMILIKESEKSKNYEKLESIKKSTKEIITFFKLEERMRFQTAFNLLKYGDSFIEIIDLDSIKVKFPSVEASANADNSIITETFNVLNSKNPYVNDSLYENLDKFIECLVSFDETVAVPKEEEEVISENSFDEESADVAKYNLKKIVLLYHKPHRILPLIDPYDNVLGYVEIKETNRSTSVNILKQFTDVIDKIGSKYPNNNSNDKYEKVVKDLSKLIVKKALQKYKKLEGQTENYDELVKNVLEPDIYYSLKRILLNPSESAFFRRKLNIRFIQPDDMIWFKTSGSDFYPFGTSIIDPLVFPGKLYMFTNLANTVYKLSKASQVRKWVVETGSKQDHSALLQKLKRNFRNMRITASDLTNTKDLPNILSDFRDIVVN